MDAAYYKKERSDEIVEEPAKTGKFLTVVPFSGSEGDYPTAVGALDQIQVPNGGKSIKSAVVKGSKKTKAAMMDAADSLKERSDEIVEEPAKTGKFLTVVPCSGSKGDYPTAVGALDQIQIPNGGKSIKSAVVKGSKKFKAAMMDAADSLKEKSDEIVEEPAKTGKFLTVVPFSGSEGEYPTAVGALDQIQVPNGGKSIKSAVVKGSKKFKAAMVKGGKKFANAMVKGGKKSWAAILRGGEKFGPACIGGCASGGIQAIAGLASD